MKLWKIFVSIFVVLLIVGCSAEESSSVDTNESYRMTETEYRSKSSDLLLLFSMYMDDLGYNLREPSVFDDYWRENVAENIVGLREIIREYNKLVPPTKLQKVHDLVIESFDNIYTMTEILPDAIDNFDGELISQSGYYMDRGIELMNEALSEADKLN